MTSSATVRGDDSPLAVRFSSDAGLDLESFSHAWIEAAQQMNGRWGIPVPLRVRPVPDDDFPRTTVQFEFGGDNVLRFDIALAGGASLITDGLWLITTAGAPEPAQRFHREFVDDWRPLRAPQGDAWWAVPRWSLPVWRAAGLQIWSGSAYPALAASAAIEKNPTILLTPAATQFLVARVAQRFPCTAAEVWAIRKEHLPQDLVDWVGGGESRRPLLHPQLVFDSAADLGSAKPDRRLKPSGGDCRRAQCCA